MTPDAESRRSALRGYVEQAPHPVMREIARLALAQNFTQDSLARALGDGMRGGNVKRHFEAEKPRDGSNARHLEDAVLLEFSQIIEGPGVDQLFAAKEACEKNGGQYSVYVIIMRPDEE